MLCVVKYIILQKHLKDISTIPICRKWDWVSLLKLFICFQDVFIIFYYHLNNKTIPLVLFFKERISALNFGIVLKKKRKRKICLHSAKSCKWPGTLWVMAARKSGGNEDWPVEHSSERLLSERQLKENSPETPEIWFCRSCGQKHWLPLF